MSGEYLPDLEEGEIEIARVTLDSVTGDVISIRARRTPEKILYQMVDEYWDMPPVIGYQIEPTESDLPLTMGQLVDMIDGVRLTGETCHMQGLTTIMREFNVDCHYTETWDFVHFTSEYYPELGSWYDDEAQEWHDRKAEEFRDPDDDDPLFQGD